MKPEEVNARTRILLVDDEEGVFRLFARALAGDETAVEIDYARSGEEGLERAAQSLSQGDPYGIAFVDLRLPTGDGGPQMAAKLWDLDPELEIVLCTGHVEDLEWKIPPARGNQLIVLAKPFHPIVLRQLTLALSDKRRLRAEAMQTIAQLEEKVRQRTSLLSSTNRELSDKLQATERSQAKLLQTQKMEAVGHIAAGVAHEINTPMQFISDNLYFLENGVAQLLELVAACDHLVTAVRESNTHTDLVERINSIATAIRLDYLATEMPRAIADGVQGTEKIRRVVRAMAALVPDATEQKTPIDINESVEHTLTVAHNEWVDVAEVVLDLATDLPLVPCYPGDLNLALLSLVVNAADAIRATGNNDEKKLGRIVVKTERDEEMATISISDSGMGIPKEIRHRIYEPMFTTKEPGTGTGQGLALAHTVVVGKHDGEIDLESEIDRGTTFRLRLPLATESTNAGDSTRG